MGRASTGVNSMYKCVPPRPLSYTFSDVLHASLAPRTPARSKCRSKTAPVSTNAAEEYAERFNSRPTTRPSVIDFNGSGVKMFTGTGGCRHPSKHGFPAVKLRNVVPMSVKPKSPLPTFLPNPLTERGTAATSSLHLAPLGKGTEPNSALSLQTKPYRPPPLPLHTTTPKSSKTPDPSRHRGGRSATSSIKSHGKSSSSLRLHASGGENMGKAVGSPLRLCSTAGNADGQWTDLSNSKLSTLDTLNFAISYDTADHTGLPEVLAHSEDYDDLSELPRPKRILPRRDLPWVFRFKVKKEMNALSKIMASKPASANPMPAAGSLA